MRRLIGLILVAGLCVVGVVGCGPETKDGPSSRVETVQVQFLQPEGAKISVYEPEENMWSAPLAIKGVMDFDGGRMFRVRLTDIPDQPGVTLWGRMTVAPVTEYTIDSAVPLEISRDDIENAKRNVLVVKVIFLPSEEFAVYAIPGAPTSIVSNLLEPGKDAVKEAEKQGTVLLVLRLSGRQYEE